MKMGKFWAINQKCLNYSPPKNLRCLAFSVTLHGVMVAFFLYFYPEPPEQQKTDPVIGLYFRPALPKEMPREKLSAPPRMATQKIPRSTNRGPIKKPNAQLTNAAPQQGDGDQQNAENEGLLAAAVDVRKTPVLLNKDDITIPYPKRALQFMIEGVVRLRLTVSENGLVTDAKILSGPQFGLQHAALTVARKLVFLPATDEDGRAMTSNIVHDVIFRLKS